MLTRITVQGFKSLEDVQDLDLGLVNVFIGANGSGKSNLLEAIGLLSAAASGQVDDQALLRRGVRPGLPSFYHSAFAGTRTHRGIQIRTTWELGQDTVEHQIKFDMVIDTRELPWAYRVHRNQRQQTRCK